MQVVHLLVLVQTRICNQWMHSADGFVCMVQSWRSLNFVTSPNSLPTAVDVAFCTFDTQRGAVLSTVLSTVMYQMFSKDSSYTTSTRKQYGVTNASSVPGLHCGKHSGKCGSLRLVVKESACLGASQCCSVPSKSHLNTSSRSPRKVARKARSRWIMMQLKVCSHGSVSGLHIARRVSARPNACTSSLPCLQLS